MVIKKRRLLPERYHLPAMKCPHRRRDIRARRILIGILSLAVLYVPTIGCAHKSRPPELSIEEMPTKECRRRQIRAGDLLELIEVGGVNGRGLVLSPDGRYFAFQAHQADVETNSYQVAWFVADTTAGSPVLVGDGGDADLYRSRLPDGRMVGAWISSYPRWSPDSAGIAYRKKVDGETQVWWSSRDGRVTEPLTDNAANVDEFLWTRDGERLLFTTGAPRHRQSQLAEQRNREGYVYDYAKDWSTIDGHPLEPPYALIGGEPEVWVLEIDSATERRATADEVREYKLLGRSQPDIKPPDKARYWTATTGKRGVAWAQPEDPEKQGIEPPVTLHAKVIDGSAEQTACTAEQCTGLFDRSMLQGGLQWRTIEDEVYFVRREGVGYSTRTLYAWRPGGDHVRRVLSTNEWISDCTILGHRALCFRETPSHPRTVVALDLQDGTITTLVDPNPGFSCLELGQVEVLEWRNKRGYETFGYLVKPPHYQTGRRYPLVFVGYRARYALRGGVGNEYPVHLLAANGFVVLVYERTDLHEARARYADRLKIAAAAWGPDVLDASIPLASFESAIDLLSERELIDPNRIAVTGLSNGVGHVNYALIHSDLFATAIASSSDFSPHGRVLIGASGSFRDYRKVIGAGPYPGPNAFLFPKISLALNVDRVDAPLLVNVSDHEHVWALEEVVALIEAGKPVEMVVYPDEGHIKWQPAHRASVYERNVDWLNFWLRDVVDETPTKREQYRRWEALRNDLAGLDPNT